MKRLLLAAAVALGAAGAAAADTLDVLVQNTLTLTDTQGGVTTVLLSEGGRFEQSNARGTWASGFWTKEKDRLCITARGEAMVCLPLQADKAVGDSWEISGPTGRLAWTAQIDEGRAKLGPAAPE
jgi:hypothetical protein